MGVFRIFSKGGAIRSPSGAAKKFAFKITSELFNIIFIDRPKVFRIEECFLKT
jgi:hypothetical protein